VKNSNTIPPLALACKHVKELMAAGVTENLSIGTLALFCDVYAKFAVGGPAVQHSAFHVPLTSWSNKVLQMLAEKWRLAVVTVEEDARLRKYLRSTRLSSPCARWGLVRIEFGDNRLISTLKRKS
jgi:hypothetical protein